MNERLRKMIRFGIIGLGYTTIRSRLAGIESHIRYFVPLRENLEIWELTLHEPA